MGKIGFWLRRGCGAVVLGWIALPALAEDIALVIGNRDYDTGAPVRGAERVVEAADALSAGDVAVLAERDADLDDLRDLLGQFEQMAPNAERLLVVLAGRFVTGGSETFFLPVEGEVPGLTGVAGRAVPLSGILQILGTAPGAAFLVLAEDGRAEAQGAFLRDGIGPLSVPQGVTVVRGAPGPVAGLLRDVIAVEGAAIEASGDLELSGYLPGGHGFLAAGEGQGAALSGVQAELAAARQRADRSAAEAERRIDAADAALWAMAQELDSVGGYARYVEVFPGGRHAEAASRLIAEIRDEPERSARLTEEALSLSRDQRRAVQRDLTALGFNTRGVDGIFGPGTRTAVAAWQEDRGRAQTGYLDRAQIDALRLAAARAEQIRAEEEAQARQEALRADRDLWREVGEGRDEAGLRAYLDRFPQGEFAPVARERLERIVQARRAEEEARAAEERRQADEAFWRQTGEGRDIPGLRAYLERYPEGRHADRARSRLADLVGEPDRPDADRSAAAAAEEALGLNRALRQSVEDRLAALGHNPGQVDGQFDDRTRQALRRYQQASGLPVTGYVSQQLVVQLLTDSVLNLLR